MTTQPSDNNLPLLAYQPFNRSVNWFSKLKTKIFNFKRRFVENINLSLKLFFRQDIAFQLNKHKILASVLVKVALLST